MDEKLRKYWKEEEACAHILGWDFSHIEGRYEEGQDLPWDYDRIVRSHLTHQMRILDYDTGGGEYLLSLRHPFELTCATEGYAPNVELCRKTLLPLGIDLRECRDPSRIPFPDRSFDLILNRHGSFDPPELYRLLKPGGTFITQQVGSLNDRDLVARVLPDLELPFQDHDLEHQRRAFEAAGFQILQTGESFRPIRFMDIGAFVWFARVIEWEFKGFSVDRCFEDLMEMHREVKEKGFIQGTTHRYLIVAGRAYD